MKLAVLALALLPLGARATPLRYEVGAGLIFSEEGQGAPVLTARAAYSVFDFLESSMRAVAVVGQKGMERATGGTPSEEIWGYQGWAVMAEGRVHTRGSLQLTASGAAGVGQILTYQEGEDETPAFHGKIGPYVQIGAGGRAFLSGELSIAVDLNFSVWPALSAKGEGIGGTGSIIDIRDAPHRSLMVLLALGW